uniref:Tight junction protein 3 n=1 Tax=Esox lucius TaxID=8010 RepID=A0A6Q2Y2X2_ESOLU
MEVRFSEEVKPKMEELTIWEQHTITLNKDSKMGFGFAISGGREKPNPDSGDTAVIVSDVVRNGPAMGRLFVRDQIVMVNGVSMENVYSTFTIQNLKSCGKIANITVKRPRKIQIPATTRPTRASSQSNLLDQEPRQRTRRYSDGSDQADRYRAASSNTLDRNGTSNALPFSSGYKRLPRQDFPDKPIKTTLLKKKLTDVERLNYIQYHPMVLFLDPHSRKDVKAMRQKLCPNSNKSSRRLYAQALKMRKHCSHLFAARIDLQPSSNVWYESLKDKIRHQQAKPVWVSEGTFEGGGEEELDALDRNHSDYLSGASDLEDTDGEAFTDGEIYTDNEDLEEQFDSGKQPRVSRPTALARSSEPASEYHSPDPSPEPLKEVPPLMSVPVPRSVRLPSDGTAHVVVADDDTPSTHSFSDSDFDAIDRAVTNSPSDTPPNFIAPNPKLLPESPPAVTLSVIEKKLQQTRMAEPEEKKASPSFIVLAHHQAVQTRRSQIRGSDSSDDNDETEDIEWGPATEL